MPTLKLIKCHRRTHALRLKQNLFGLHPIPGVRKIGKGSLKGCVIVEDKSGPKPFHIYKQGHGFVLEFIAVIRVTA